MSLITPLGNPYDVKDSYSLLVPHQKVDAADLPFNPEDNGEVRRRVPFPRNLYHPAWKIAVQGAVSHCKRPSGIKYYYPLAKVKMGIGRAFRAFYDPDTGEYSKEMGTDARASVALKDTTGVTHGYLYKHKCHEANMLVTIRDPVTPEKVIKVGYCFLSHESNIS